MIAARLLSLLLVVVTTVSAASDTFCSCTHGGAECDNDPTACCPSAAQTCSMGQKKIGEDLSFQLPSDIGFRRSLSSDERRALSITAIQRLQQSGQVHQRWYTPLWEEGNGTVLSSPIVEVEEIYRTAAGVFGALIKSDGVHTLVLNGDTRLYARCMPSSTEDQCFPLVLEPAVRTLTKITPEHLVIAYAPGARQAALTMAEELAVVTLGKTAKIAAEDLTAEFQTPLCVLLCGPATLSEQQPNSKQPAARSEYRYLPMPGAAERITWLTSVASVVIIGTWNGSYKFSMA